MPLIKHQFFMSLLNRWTYHGEPYDDAPGYIDQGAGGADIDKVDLVGEADLVHLHQRLQAMCWDI